MGVQFSVVSTPASTWTEAIQDCDTLVVSESHIAMLAKCRLYEDVAKFGRYRADHAYLPWAGPETEVAPWALGSGLQIAQGGKVKQAPLLTKY